MPPFPTTCKSHDFNADCLIDNDSESTYLFLASEVRSGSTFVAELISYSLHASAGGEVWDLTKEHLRHLNDRSTPADVSASVSTLWLSPQRIRSSKVMCSELSVLTRCARLDAALHDMVFGTRAKWIVVRRRNKIRQAVSLAVARKTKQFHVYSNQMTDNFLNISMGEIENSLHSIILSDLFLESFRSVPEIAIELFYEDVVAAPEKSVFEAMYKLGMISDISQFSFEYAKLVPDRQGLKTDLELSFRHWLLENHHAT